MKTDNTPADVIEAAGKPFDLVGDCVIEAAADTTKKHTFRLMAYTGGLMRVNAFFDPVVVDLGGAITLRSSQLPILDNHNHSTPIGHAESGGVKISAAGIEITGTLSGAGTPEGARVLELARNGYKYQASIGLNPTTRERVEAGSKATVNGQEVQGPAWIIRAGELYECSLVAVGADRGSSALVASKPTTEPVATPPADDPEAIRAAARAEAAAESERIDAIRAVCGRHRMPGIEANAIRQGWTPERAELEILRANNALSPSVGSGMGGGKGRTMDGEVFNRQVLECAAVLQSGVDPERASKRLFSPEVVEAAHNRPIYGLVDLIQRAGNIRANPGSSEFIQAAIGSHEVSDVLSNVANKIMVESYASAGMMWKSIAAERSLNDFKTTPQVRLQSKSGLRPVGTSGVLDLGQLVDDKYELQADPHGLVFRVTRKMLINDDLGLFQSLPKQIGRLAANAVNSALGGLINGGIDAGFFSEGNGNLLEGTDTVLSVNSLSAARKALRNQIAEDGHPINANPRHIVVPPELEDTAESIIASKALVAAGGDTLTTLPAAVVAGRGLGSVVVPYMGEVINPGSGSDTAWMLSADTAVLAPFMIGFVGGRSYPQLTRVPQEAAFDGISWNVVFDFGVNYGDHRAAVYATGVA